MPPSRKRNLKIFNIFQRDKARAKRAKGKEDAAASAEDSAQVNQPMEMDPIPGPSWAIPGTSYSIGYPGPSVYKPPASSSAPVPSKASRPRQASHSSQSTRPQGSSKASTHIAESLESLNLSDPSDPPSDLDDPIEDDYPHAPSDFQRQYGILFDQRVSNMTFTLCGCGRKQLDINVEESEVCRQCKIYKDRYLASNRMDPGPIPEELSNLTLIEQMLIAQIHPIMSIFRRGGGAGEIHYTGNVMNFRQDIYSYTTDLPHDIEAMNSIIIFEKQTYQGLAHFRARAGHLRRALKWLKRYNFYYKDITISEENLAKIPSGGDVTDLLPYIDEPNEEDLRRVTEEIDSDDSYVPLLDPPNHKKTIFNILNLPYPELDESEPICEYTEDGYIVKAFPALFPRGDADINQPRNQKVDLKGYFNFLMLYKDGRFAKDPRFRFFAMNTLLRAQATRTVGVMLRQIDQTLTVRELRERVTNVLGFMNRLIAYCSQLRSTKAYWRHRCSELLKMVEELGKPTVFFTLSDADHHWPDLYRLICQDNNRDYRNLSQQERKKLMRDNPMITSRFFERRCEIFVKEILTPVFNVKDYWYRYEWQWRGSPHIHGLLWLADAPKFDEAKLNSQTVEQIRAYFDKLCSAEFINSPDSPVHPSQKRFSEVNARHYKRDMGNLLKTFQIHSRCGSNCLKKQRNSNVFKCRYDFPKQLRQESTVFEQDGELKFEPKRNHERLSKFNHFVTQVWRANTDFSPVLSLQAVINYICKYASKGEKSSVPFNEMLSMFCTREPNESPAKRVLHRLLISTLGDRDYSSQEVIHILMDWPLYHSSRAFVSLNLRALDQSFVSIRGDSIKISKNAIDFYRTRPATLKDWNLASFHRVYYKRVERGKEMISKRTKVLAIVRVFPILRLNGEPENDEKYYRQQVILHKPFTNEVFDSPTEFGQYTSWEDAFNGLGLTHPEALDFPEPMDEGEVIESINDTTQIDPFMALSAATSDVLREENLGRRLIDAAYDWDSTRVESPTMDQVKAFLESYKNVALPSASGSANIFTFTPQQMAVIQICRSQLEGNHGGLKRVIVQGKAGCGKSTIIKKMVFKITQRLGPGSVAVAAPTGAAAVNIDGETLHSLLRLPLSKDRYEPLQGIRSMNFQTEKANLKFLIIDEMSMVGLSLFNNVEKRCREIHPDVNEPFGGLFVYLFGDYYQLPPVLNTAVYSENIKTPSASQGMNTFLTFQKFVKLTESHRQAGADGQNFRDMLERLSTGNFNEQDFNLLMTRRAAALPPQERKNFDQLAIKLLPTNNKVDDHNNRHLERTGNPVARIVSVNHPDVAMAEKEDGGVGLSAVLNLSIGCRVMLRTNLWVKGGLVNGSLGTLRKIVYAPGDLPPMLPAYVLIEFDRYDGEKIVGNLFPIIPIARTWIKRNVKCSRTMLPITVAHAVTIHKSQGLTLDKISIDLGDKETTLGLSYVALSRVRNLNDICLLGAYTANRFKSINKAKSMAERNKFMNSRFSSS